MKILELILAVLSALGIILKMFLVPGSSAIITFTLSTLSLLYLILGFNIFNNYSFKPGNAKKSFFGVILGILISSGVLGLLFKVMIWPGAQVVMQSGFLGFALYLLLIITDKEKYYKNKSNIVRLGVIATVCIGAYLLPNDEYIKFTNRKCPAAGEALIKAKATNKQADWEIYSEKRMECEKAQRKR
ncbi:MAG: hypothetical protein JXQ87_04295 [Bacteroidia bacterium]